MKRVFLSLFALLLLAVVAGTLYFLYQKAEEPPVVYETVPPVVTDIIEKTVATGSVVPRKEVEIKPRISGIVDEIYVEPGDLIEAGALVAKIRVIPNMVSLNEAETRVNRARIELENAKLDRDRNRPLLADGTLSEAAFQSFELAYKTAAEEVKAAVSNLDLIRKGTTSASSSSSNTLVRATITGMVLEVPLEVGSSVIESNTFNDGTTIATIADMDDLIFEGKVDESEVGKLRTGMDLLLTIGAIEEERFSATLEHIAPKGVEENGAIQFEIRAAIELKDEIFVRANYSANADIVLARRDQVLAVQESLLQFEGDEVYVEVETAPQTFERRPVETGLSDGLVIEVLSGLGAEDRVKDPNSGQAV